MSRFFVLIAVIAACVAAAPNKEDMKARFHAEMKEAGLSEPTIAEICKISEKHQDAFKAAKGNKEEAKAAFHALKTDIDTYIVTASAADQAAWKIFEDKKKAEFKSHFEKAKQ
ncbi:unnamed protein product [Caenorhabditis auriculariae]|uniref:SXP/RAL-2 family protein Ani s 5-like cation-binding domain-containing protein n=1 Tax=Caenorhabditis auriculariae TaxID=2777116 RepID=A0A8S1HAK8_9PELO|nr:unnamed protein product [Caenorhabditis auriculariae]